jgi:integrase/recombinase XerD
MRVNRKVKIDGRWVLAPVPLDKNGRPDARHVLRKGQLVPVAGGTFYLDSGRGARRKQVACGTDPESVKRAMKTQAHVIELRSRGMQVGDAPEIVDSRRDPQSSLRAIAKAFEEHPPAGLTKKSVAKYCNAFRTFAAFAAAEGALAVDQVSRRTVTKWIGHMQTKELLDAATIVPKVRIVLAELKDRGNAIELKERDLPVMIERERSIYELEELEALFAACTIDEYELFQTFLITGMRRNEVAFIAWSDVNPAQCTVRVSAKKELGFVPKAYHERTIPVTRQWVEMMQARGERLCSDGVGLIFGTSRGWTRRGNAGGRGDRKLLEKLKQVARRAGLNCGHCTGSHAGKAVTCRTHAICRRWGLHKFRHTYATSMLRDKVDIVTVSRWLGHKDLKTTRIYLRALEAEAAQPQVESSTLAKRFGGRPPAADAAVRRASRSPR